MLKILVLALLVVTLSRAQDVVLSTAGGPELGSVPGPPFMTQLLNGNILFFGGSLNTTVLEYNPMTGNTTTRASLPHNVYFDPCVVTASTGEVYVIGGIAVQSDLASVLSEVLIYDPVQDSWTNGQNMTTIGRARPSCGYDPVLQNIHVLGGQNTVGSGIVVNPHVIYSIANDTWHNASNPTADHGRLGRAYYEPKSKSMVFVGGAFTTAQSVYNTETGNWTQWAPVPDVTYFYALVVRPDRVLLLGGAEKSTLFTYFIANDTWVNGTTNTVGFQDFYANTAQVGGSVYALGSDARLYVARCLVPDNCDGSDPCFGSCVAETGFCAPLSDVTCDDNDPCTLEDMCLNGVCTAGNKTAIECIPPGSEPMADSPLSGAPLSNGPSTVPVSRTSHASVLGKSLQQLIFILCTTISFSFF